MAAGVAAWQYGASAAEARQEYEGAVTAAGGSKLQMVAVGAVIKEYIEVSKRLSQELDLIEEAGESQLVRHGQAPLAAAEGGSLNCAS